MGIGPAKIWWWSCQAHKKRLSPLARLLKWTNYALFKTLLPYEAQIEKDLVLLHYSLGNVVHPNVVIGHNVVIYHHVTLAASTWIGSPHKIIIEDEVHIGAGAIIIARDDTTLTVGKGAKIGAGAVVTRDVPPGARMVGVPASPLREETRTRETKE